MTIRPQPYSRSASIVVAQQMPRYDLSDEACTDLWAWVNERR